MRSQVLSWQKKCKLLLRLTLRHMCRSTLDQACLILGMSVGGVGHDS